MNLPQETSLLHGILPCHFLLPYFLDFSEDIFLYSQSFLFRCSLTHRLITVQTHCTCSWTTYLDHFLSFVFPPVTIWFLPSCAALSSFLALILCSISDSWFSITVSLTAYCRLWPDTVAEKEFSLHLERVLKKLVLLTFVSLPPCISYLLLHSKRRI